MDALLETGTTQGEVSERHRRGPRTRRYLNRPLEFLATSASPKTSGKETP
jgi:hypothetical protein